MTSEFKPKDVFNLKRTSSPFSQTHLKNLGRINFEFIIILSFLMLIKEDIYSSGLHKCVQLFFSTGAFKSSATAPPRCLQNFFLLLQKRSQKISASFCRMMILRNNPPWSVVIRKKLPNPFSADTTAATTKDGWWVRSQASKLTDNFKELVVAIFSLQNILKWQQICRQANKKT